MAKNILQDIVPPEKRSIRNIPLPNRSTKREPVRVQKDVPVINRMADVNPPVSERNVPPISEPVQKIYSYDENKFPSSVSKVNKKSIIFSAIGAIVIIAIAVASMFTSATVTITPIIQAATIDNSKTLEAKSAPTTDELGFQVLTLTKSLGKEVPATGEEKVERKASGTIVIYNNVDTASQRLIKNTRFESTNGLIYRINESVVVPGKKGDQPGSIETVVYADEAGDKYNIGKTDFTIPGFKSDSVRYKGIYARSKTAMEGGIVGTIKKVSESDQKAAQTELRNTLTEELKKDALSQIPEGFVLLDSAYQVAFSELPQSNDTGSMVTVNEQGVFKGFLFSQKDLSKYLASKFAPEIVKNNVAISDPKTLSFAFSDADELRAESPDKITFTISGSASFISQFDEMVIKSDLIGKSKSSLGAVMANYPGVKSADSVVRPFWKRNFPESEEDITILIKTQQ